MSSPLTRLARCTAEWFLALCFCIAVLCSSGAEAYIPASPTNFTLPSMNDSSPSKLVLEWFHGGDSEDVSYQLVGADSSGFNQVRTCRSGEEGHVEC